MNKVDKEHPENLNVENNEEVNAYYEKKINQAKALFNDKKTKQDAIELLNEELDQPYIPIAYFDRMTDLVNQFEIDLKVQTLDENEKNLTVEKLLKEAITDHKFDAVTFDHIVSKDPDALNEEKNQKLLEIFFLDEHLANIDKLFVLDLMGQKGIDKEYNFLNAVTHKTTHVNPYHFVQDFQTKEHQTTSKLLDELTFKDPALNKFCTDVLLHCVTYYYPDFGFSSPEGLKEAILYHVKNMLGLEEEKKHLNDDEKKVAEILNSIQ